MFASKLLDDRDDGSRPNQMFVLKLFDDVNGGPRPDFSAIIANRAIALEFDD